jgi:hypothetical protein
MEREPERIDEVISRPFTLEDQDRIVGMALKIEDPRFQLTPGQAETLRRAAIGEEIAILFAERRKEREEE